MVGAKIGPALADVATPSTEMPTNIAPTIAAAMRARVRREREGFMKPLARRIKECAAAPLLRHHRYIGWAHSTAGSSVPRP
jgi:hypothetical protein